MTDTIKSFTDKYRFLSNFWPAQVLFDGVTYLSVEHAYVASKTLCLETRAKITKIHSPGQVKRYGRTLVLRPDWDDVKLGIMRQLVTSKFSSHHLAQLLLATGDAELIEGNTWGDKFWGVCRGEGSNHLGKILMDVRAQIRADRKAV